MASAAEIDEAIFAVVHERGQKVAMVMYQVSKYQTARGVAFGYDEVAARIGVLIEEGKLECAGNPRRPRHSEVRLPGQPPERQYYCATVAVVFPAWEPELTDVFDLHEMDILFESDTPEQAPEDAIALSKKSQTWRALEYPEHAVLHAMRQIRPVIPKFTLPSWHTPQEWFHMNSVRINREDLEMLKSGGEIDFTYGFIYIDE